MLDSEFIVSQLSRYFRDNGYIVFAVLFGSFARNQARDMSDIDIAVYPSKELTLDEKIELIYYVAKCLDVCEDRINIVFLNNLTPLELRYKIFRDGILIFSRNIDVYRRFRDESISMYIDFMLSLRTVGYGEKYIKKIRAEVYGAKRKN
ncbi:MAG: nucleotidyltransferase domain-containing protein [Candidatus Njordarchaeota archaeon]